MRASAAAPAGRDPFDARRVRAAPEPLREFNDAGVLSAADVHVASRLGALGGERDPWVVLAVALAVRGPRLGHVHVDLTTIRETATVDAEEPVEVSGLPWPPPGEWIARVGRSPLVAEGEDGGAERPLRLLDSRLHLDRYWREERRIAADLLALAEAPAPGVDLAVLAGGLDRLFSGAAPDAQRLAAASAVLRPFAVVAGGPGTGKTTTVARIVALLAEQAVAAGTPAPLVALAAPTGKAAARLEEAVHEEAADLAVDDATRAHLHSLAAVTLHRLLGRRPGSHSRFRHHAANRLPHDVVIVDETSMVSLSLMARLVEAVRPAARLILVGDPGQLSSIEAGAVLGDVVGPAAGGLRMRPAARAALAEVTGHPVAAEDPPAPTAAGDGIVMLERVHRFGGAIAELASAIRAGDADGAIAVLGRGADGVTWIPADAGDPAELGPVRAGVLDAARAVAAPARAGDGRAAIAALGAFRLLCAHRRGPHGVATWTQRIEGWLAEEVEGIGAGGGWYAGRPLLVTENDYALRLYNGDTGVVVTTAAGRPAAAFERRGALLELSPARLGAVDTVYAMTIHKSQGSQFGTAAVLLPEAGSPVLTRELLYTAVTRARERLILAGPEATIRAAVERPVARASGLRERLWGPAGPPAASAS